MSFLWQDVSKYLQVHVRKTLSTRCLFGSHIPLQGFDSFHCSAKNEGPKRSSHEDKLLGIFLITGSHRGLGVQRCSTTTRKQKKAPKPKSHVLLVSGGLCKSQLWLRRGGLGSSRAGEDVGTRAHRRLLSSDLVLLHGIVPFLGTFLCVM